MGLVKVMRIYLNTYTNIDNLVEELRNYCDKLHVIKSNVVPAFIFLELWSPRIDAKKMREIIAKYVDLSDVVRIDLVEVKVRG